MKRDDIRAQAAVRDIDTALVMLESSLYELSIDQEMVGFKKFSKTVAKKAALKLSIATLRELGNNRGNFHDNLSIDSWYKQEIG